MDLRGQTERLWLSRGDGSRVIAGAWGYTETMSEVRLSASERANLGGIAGYYLSCPMKRGAGFFMPCTVIKDAKKIAK